ncbi:O-Antigen ligase [Sodalis glossinidius str. 'morsitans']|uniref:O-Antigen ligase n=1 Tax=Sodalis glossinidius (strain morsitans) TaxID=343509 RepID=A0A193QFD2_SODGM|nr:O-antigen ligase family protein [Sodalis glossinidius]CRL43879.1 O-Antigen ligase [Sodalis glossinidius str. 'morsitans']
MSMLLIKKYSRLENVTLIMFTAFLFFSTLFCNVTKVNNLFHLSCGLLLLSLLFRGQLYRDAQQDRVTLRGLGLIALMAVYFALSNIWGGDAGETISTLTHGVYLIIFTLLGSLALQNVSRHTLMVAAIAGVTVLSVFTIATDASKVIYLRKVSEFNPGPDNVIDLAGYCAIAIMLSMIIARERRRVGYLLLAVIPAVMLVMTQSRGPLLALVLVMLATLRWRRSTPRAMGFAVLLALLAALLLIFTPVGDLLLMRFESLSNESGLRLSIWHHVLAEVGLRPWLGLGFNHELNFINYDGTHISTAHSVYLGTLYKGGVIGLALLALLLGYGLLCALRAFRAGYRLEAAIYLFMLLFIASQGMFMISNPRETWILFWLPLAVVFSAGSRAAPG